MGPGLRFPWLHCWRGKVSFSPNLVLHILHVVLSEVILEIPLVDRLDFAKFASRDSFESRRLPFPLVHWHVLVPSVRLAIEEFLCSRFFLLLIFLSRCSRLVCIFRLVLLQLYRLHKLFSGLYLRVKIHLIYFLAAHEGLLRLLVGVGSRSSRHSRLIPSRFTVDS